MQHLKFAFRTLFKTPFVTIIAIVSLALGIGANAAIFSCFQPDAARVAERAAAGGAGQPVGAGAEAGLAELRPGRRLRRRLQLRDVPRPAEGADRLHRHRGAPAVRRQPGLRRADDEPARGCWSRATTSRSCRCSRRSGGCSTRTTIASSAKRPSPSCPRLLDDEVRRRSRTCSTGPSGSTARR